MAEKLVWLALVIVLAFFAYVGLYFDFTRQFTIVLLLITGVFVGTVYIYLNISSATENVRRVEVAKLEAETRKLNSIARTRLQIQTRATIKRIVKSHLEKLARRRLALVRIDQYGVVESAAWNKEVQYFIDKVIRPELTEAEANSLVGDDIFTATFQTLIDEPVSRKADQIERNMQFSETMSPTEFEKWCALELEKQGWSCLITRVTGDQGADVVAEKAINGSKKKRLVIQCKLYSSAVGNKAIQEAYAAKSHYVANHAAVVTNAKFTTPAKELAQSTKVFLWHFSDLSQIDKFL